MTQEHPITPPSELMQQWWDGTHGALYEFEAVATQAARWGADMELEACCEHLKRSMSPRATIDYLRAARRPEPEPEGVTDEELDELFIKFVQSGEPQSWRAYARAVLARWGK